MAGVSSTEVMRSRPAPARPSGGGPAGLTPSHSPSGSLGSWLAILGLTAIGGLLRFWRLGVPHKLVFDETYYVKQGVSMLRAGYELKWKGEGKVVDPLFNAGNTDVFTDQPDFVVHPPVGKWMIAGGEWLFGSSNSFGWRFSAALAGTLSILMIILIARRLFSSTLIGLLAGLLLTVDGQHFVHSRTGLLDIFVMFWALAAFGCLVIDRDVARARLARRIGDGAGLNSFGPGLGIRWWRLAAAVCLGLCAGTKWSGLFFAAVFLTMSVLWDAGARRAAAQPNWAAVGLVRDGGLAALTVLPVMLGVYLASWTGWFRSTNAFDRQWADTHPSTSLVPGAIRSLWHYHSQMYDFNVGLAEWHPYKANPWSWIVMGRPTAFFYEKSTQGTSGCQVKECAQAIVALGNPVIWWGATLAILVLLFQWALRRDWRAGAVLAGLAGGYLPWFHYQDRTIYNFYTIAFTPWVVLALTYVLALMLGPPGAGLARRRRGVLSAGAVVLVAVLVFWFFLPIYSAEVIPKSGWSDRMWLTSWI
jgi:dolichyl-phosphate-mannose--protein O-mannosyl transferase